MERMCQPPRHTMETRSLGRPSLRAGTPVADDLDVCAITRRARVATDAPAAARFTKSLREVVLGMAVFLREMNTVVERGARWQPAADSWMAPSHPFHSVV